MNLYFTSAYRAHTCLDRVNELFALDLHGVHSITEDPHAADAIVFVENTQFDDLAFSAVMSHPLVSRYPGKVFMYNETDRAWPVLPGLYCSLGQGLASGQSQVAFPYLTAGNDGIRHIHTINAERTWLYSFVGATSHASRRALFRLTDERACIVDTSEFCTWNPVQPARYQFQKLYTDSIADSKFVLCPRGIGPASLRLYETIEAGRVPVIISDSWVPSPQIDWSFAVKIPESQVTSIPEILRALESEWEDRGNAARRAWLSTYAPDQLFNTLCNAIQQISPSAGLPALTFRARLLKRRVLAEQKVRNLIRPTQVLPAAQTTLLNRLFSRRV